jgi:hypothetical protein
MAVQVGVLVDPDAKALNAGAWTRIARLPDQLGHRH